MTTAKEVREVSKKLLVAMRESIDGETPIDVIASSLFNIALRMSIDDGAEKDVLFTSLSDAYDIFIREEKGANDD